MATLTFETLQFSKHADSVRVTFLKYYTFSLANEELEKIGSFSVTDHSITFPDTPEKKVLHRFQILLEKGFAELRGTVTKKPTIYIHQNSGIPLWGSRFIGIQDRGTNFLEVKPITGCTMGCTFCSVDEGIGSKKNYDFIVEREYLINEVRKLLEFKQCPNIHIYINVHGEPLLYADMVGLIHDLRAISWVKEITIITTAVLLTEQLVDQLTDAGLTEFNVSISAMDTAAAKDIMGTKAYDISHVKKIVAYAAKKVKTTIAPVWVEGINDSEMEKIVAFGKEIHCPIRIQKFCLNKFGRNPAEELSWDEFFAKIAALEMKTGAQLKEDISAYTLEKTKEYPVPFQRKEVVEAQVIGPGRYLNERLCVCRDRLISVSPCRKDSGKIKVRILRTTHNVIVGEEV